MQQRTAMGAKGLIFSYYLLFIASNVFSQTQRISTHYEIEEKYSCVKNLDIFFDRAVLFRYARNFLQSWPGNTNFDCTTTAYSRTSKMGIIGVIQRMNLRKNSECLDSINFDEGDVQRCGEIVFGLRKGRGGNLPPPPLFISEYSGPFLAVDSTYELDINRGQKTISKRTELVSSGSVVRPLNYLHIYTRIHASKLSPGEELEMAIAFTGYKGAENQTEKTILTDIIYRLGSVPRVNSTGRVGTRSIYVRGEEYANFNEKTLEEVKNIGVEFKKHNGIMERLSDLIESAIAIFRDKETPK